MDLRTLTIFTEVVRYNGFTEAARNVHATQSTVSKAVKQLEDTLGVTLLDRVGRRINLTAAGEIVHRRALAILAERTNMVNELDELRGLSRGQLRLGLPAIGADSLFAPSFTAYHRQYPGISLQLVEGGCRFLEDRLRAGDVELAGLLQPVSAAFEWRAIRCEPIVALVSHQHPLATRGAVALRDLADEPFILFEEGFTMNSIVGDACLRTGFSPRVAARSSQVSFVVELAAAGLGVGFLPRLIALQHEHEGTALLTLSDTALLWDMALAWRRGAYLSQAARAWVEMVVG
ncbi:LysR substrate-binding domain-containing protein [Acidocella aminolytica]|jgi:DNA-binding transcriptional LysR family regulator|uniref:Transcriptional regulator LysR n=1 Tax=Acidocella aminolytica 101 = DSM 11237 TaxID=1120923 RepID=A0A0D6PL92_9PROT|nr:LysR substrate-binding domain-containing protein [Acidocella aminolytica]GAN82136.1 transcriptional regulator LysR [Acidocella aminolytica 101 = DSM 11237]GBQ37375.1 transcriptional regulator [Acidocella aminolytica 101 = DSM 11237]SHF21393.1 DNA-binding transcriptional regulator, LysR family [Acidocella aminolytica 101 = DSM 11237]